MFRCNYLCLVESSKQQTKEVGSKKILEENSEKRQLLSDSGFVLYIAPPSLSRDRRIKMKKSSSSSLHKKSQLLFGFCYSFFRFIFCFSSRFFLFRTAFILSHFRFQITPADIIWNLLLFKLHTEIDHRWYW